MKSAHRDEHDHDNDHHHLITVGDLALEIISRLPAKSLIRFSLVCHQSLTLSRDPHLIHRHLFRSLDHDPHLLFHVVKPSMNELYVAEFSNCGSQENEDVLYCNRLPNPFGFPGGETEVVGSCHGMLCLKSWNSSDNMFIYNPFTRQFKELPKSTQFKADAVVYGFGFHSGTRAYKVIKILYRHIQRVQGNVDSLTTSEIQVLNINDNSWRHVGEAPFKVEYKSGVLTDNGRLHWKGHGFIISFDLSDEKFRQVPQIPAFDDENWYGCQLMNIRGHLSVVVPVTPSNCSRFDVWIMRDYGVEESWVKQFSIGDYLPLWNIGDQSKMTMEFLKTLWKWTKVRVLCVLKNGTEMLVEYKCGGGIVLVSYDSESGEFRKLNINWMPDQVFGELYNIGTLDHNNVTDKLRINTIVHVGTFKWIDK